MQGARKRQDGTWEGPGLEAEEELEPPDQCGRHAVGQEEECRRHGFHTENPGGGGGRPGGGEREGDGFFHGWRWTCKASSLPGVGGGVF